MESFAVCQTKRDNKKYLIKNIKNYIKIAQQVSLTATGSSGSILSNQLVCLAGCTVQMIFISIIISC